MLSDEERAREARDIAPPRNLEAERAVLGACLVNPDAYDLAAGILTDADWSRDHHRTIWRALTALRKRGVALDVLLLADELGETKLADVGGPGYLASLADGMPRSANVEHYARVVRRCALQRRLAVAQGAGQWAVVARIAAELEAPATAEDEEDPFIFGGDVPGSPEEVTEGTAWAGRVSVIHGGAGSGKTTILAWLAARASENGAKVLVLAPDDPDGWQSRLTQFGAAPEMVGVATRAPVAGLHAHVEKHGADLVVLDSLARVATVEGVNLDPTADADRIMTPLVALAREGCAVAIIHHEPWADGGDRSTVARPRNSTALTAAADAVINVHRRENVTTVEPGMELRHGIPQVKRCYRLTAHGFVLDFEGDPFGGSGGAGQPADAEGQFEQMDAAITSYLMQHPDGVSGAAVRRSVGGRVQRVLVRLAKVGRKDSDGKWRPVPAPKPLPPEQAEQAVPGPVPAPVPIDGNSPEQAVPGPVPAVPDLKGEQAVPGTGEQVALGNSEETKMDEVDGLVTP